MKISAVSSAHWIRGWLSTTIWLLLSLNYSSLPCLSAGHAELKESIEQLRKKIPEAKTLSEQNGISITDANNESFTMTRLAAAASALSVSTTEEALVLLSYLEDGDPKIRYIAAIALNAKLKSYPNGLSMDDITGADPRRHNKLVTTFREQIATSKAFLPDCLRQLLTADNFADSVRGESPDPPKDYILYAAAAKVLPLLVTDDLLYVRNHALPAGRIYAAILLKHSGQTDSASFGKLLSDKAPVRYLSGCKGMQTTVADVAHGFVEKGRYYNFDLRNECTVVPPPKGSKEVQH